MIEKTYHEGFRDGAKCAARRSYAEGYDRGYNEGYERGCESIQDTDNMEEEELETAIPLEDLSDL